MSDAPPPEVPQTTPGPWEQDLMPGFPDVLPLADTFDVPVPGAEHYKDRICFWLSIPKYSQYNSPNLPWEQFRLYAQHHLAVIHGADSPVAKTWMEIGP